MARIQRSVASIRFVGDALNPEAVSAELGCSPTLSYAKGDVRPKKRGPVVWQSGMWLLEAKPCEPENLDAQVEELLMQLTPDLTVWERLTSTLRVDLFVGLFLEGSDEGAEVSADTLRALGERGVKLSMCVYAPGTD